MSKVTDQLAQESYCVATHKWPPYTIEVLPDFIIFKGGRNPARTGAVFRQSETADTPADSGESAERGEEII